MLAIARCLVARGHRATVFTTVADDLESLWLPSYKTFPAEDFTIDGVAVRRFPICYRKWRRRATRLAGALPIWRWKVQFWRPGFRAPGLNEAVRECGADVFHIGPLPYNNLMYAGLQAGESLHVPVVCTPCLHLGEQGSNAVLRHYLQAHQLQLLQHCDRVLCMTDVEREHLERAGVPANRLRTIGHGIDLQQATGGDGQRIRTRYNIDGPIVLHLGVKAYEKGSMTLVEAMQSLWKKGSRGWLVMAGASMSDFNEFLEAQPQSMPRLVNLPAFADEEKRDLLAAATVVAQPSRVESLGLIMMEACANLKPVVAADIEVSRKLIAESGAGAVVGFGDSAALAAELRRLLADEELRREMGRCGRAVAQAYDGGALFERNAEELEEAALGARRGE
jgi:glycogen synthase